MVKVQPTTDHDLAEVAEAPAPACAQDNESDGEQPRRKLAWRLSSRLLGDNDATRRDTAKGGRKAAKKSRRSLVLKGHTNWVNCLAALDGSRLASGSDDKSIIIWSVADGTQLAKLEPPAPALGILAGVNRLAALGGDRLASVSYHLILHKDKANTCHREQGNIIHIWNVADGKQLGGRDVRSSC